MVLLIGRRWPLLLPRARAMLASNLAIVVVVGNDIAASGALDEDFPWSQHTHIAQIKWAMVFGRNIMRRSQLIKLVL